MTSRIQMYYGLDPDKPYVAGFYIDENLAQVTPPSTPYDITTVTTQPGSAYEWASAFEQGFISQFVGIGVLSFRCVITVYASGDPDTVTDLFQQDFAPGTRLAGLYTGVKGQVFGLKSFNPVTHRPSLLAVGLINSSVETLGPGASAQAFANANLNKFITFMNGTDRVCVTGFPETEKRFQVLGPVLDQMYHSVRRHH